MLTGMTGPTEPIKGQTLLAAEMNLMLVLQGTTKQITERMSAPIATPIANATTTGALPTEIREIDE
jgi:hypothetical protein